MSIKQQLPQTMIIGVLLVVVVIGLVYFSQTLTGKVVGQNDPYFASPSTFAGSHVMKYTNPFEVIVAIPGDFVNSSTKVTKIQYDVFKGDISTPEKTYIIQDPSNPASSKRILVELDTQNGVQWTLVTSTAVLTSQAMLFNNPTDSDETGTEYFTSGVKKLSVTITLKDILTGAEQTVSTPVKVAYILGV